MSDPNSGIPPSRIEERISELRQLVGTLQTSASQIVEASAGFYEKLMLLNSGTLTLLFTVVASVSVRVHSNGVIVRNAADFIRACWFLVASTILCLVHNQLNLSLRSHIMGASAFFALESQIRAIGRTLKAEGHQTSFDDQLAANSGDREKLSKNSLRVEKLCRRVGPVAQLLTVCAFIELAIFITSNMIVLL